MRYLSSTPWLTSRGDGAGEREGDRGIGVSSLSSPLLLGNYRKIVSLSQRTIYL